MISTRMLIIHFQLIYQPFPLLILLACLHKSNWPLTTLMSQGIPWHEVCNCKDTVPLNLFVIFPDYITITPCFWNYRNWTQSINEWTYHQVSYKRNDVRSSLERLIVEAWFPCTWSCGSFLSSQTFKIMLKRPMYKFIWKHYLDDQ